MTNKLLSEWYDIKKQISKLQSKEDEIKQTISNIMDDEDVSIIETNNYKVSRSYNKRTSLSKNSIPEELWKKYCKTIEYSTFSLKKI